MNKTLLFITVVATGITIWGAAQAGEPGSIEPEYHGVNRDYPMYGKPDPSIGPGVPGNDYNIQIGDWANDNHYEEGVDLVHADDTNI